MSITTRLLISAVLVTSVFVTHTVASADPDLDTDSAAEVVTELREQGYAVEVKGVSTVDPALLSTCTVTSIKDTGQPTSDPTTTTTVYVEVACPIQHS